VKLFEMTVVNSSYGGGLLSLRHKGSASAVKNGLGDAGFRPGDRVVLIPLDEYLRLTEGQKP
jgi:hypothetical protein